MGENADGGFLLVRGQKIQQCGREIHFQQEFSGVVCKAAGGVGVTVAVGDVGLDVKDGGAVHQIGTADMEDGAVFFCMLHPQQVYAGKPQIVGAERGTGGEDAHAGVSAQPGRAHRGGPALTDGLGKLPDDPQVGEIFNAPQGIWIPELRLKDDGGA